jgi:NADH-quinone oxidoreductase subunit E
MSVRRLAPETVQPASFAFSKASMPWVEAQIAKYPTGREASAVIPLLWKAQQQAGGWLPRAAIEHVAITLNMPNIRVLEVATFYTMFNLEPVGTFFVQLCGTTPCMLRGAKEIRQVCQEKIGPEKTVTADGAFSWMEVECLGACCNAPMVQINDDYYEDLTPENFAALLDDLKAGKKVKLGPQVDRSCSEPLGGAKTLQDKALYDGSVVGSWRKGFDERVKAMKAAAAAAAVPAPAVLPATPVKTAKAKAPVAPKAAAPKASASKPAAAKPIAEAKPELLKKPRGGKGDALELIWGVGPKLAKMLNEMGVWHFDQIAAWTKAELAYIDTRLEGFKGRAQRDEWIKQAKKLAKGWRPEKAVGDKPKK